MSAPSPGRLALALALAAALSGCVTQTRSGGGPPPPSAQQQEAAHRAELRFRAKAHTDLAAAYYERKQYAVALEEIEDALHIDGSYVSAWNLRGLVYMALREDALAEESFDKGFRAAPNDPELGNNYGYFLCTRGRQREGLARLDAVIRDPLYQTPEKPLVNAALCELSQHNDAGAEQWLRRAVRVAPTDPQGAYLLAQLLADHGHPGEAREVLRPLLRVDNPAREVLALMIDLDRRLDDKEQLRQHGEQMHRLYPDPVGEPGKPQENRP